MKKVAKKWLKYTKFPNKKLSKRESCPALFLFAYFPLNSQIIHLKKDGSKRVTKKEEKSRFDIERKMYRDEGNERMINYYTHMPCKRDETNWRKVRLNTTVLTEERKERPVESHLPTYLKKKWSKISERRRDFKWKEESIDTTAGMVFLSCFLSFHWRQEEDEMIFTRNLCKGSLLSAFFPRLPLASD